MIDRNIFSNQIEGHADERRCQYPENVGNNDKQHSRYKSPTVFVKEFIQVSKTLHGSLAKVGFFGVHG
jgi:hypothetical protein